MAAASLLKYAYLAYFAKPTADRALYRLVRKRKPVRILELGIGNGQRMLSLLAVAQRYATAPIHYAALDLFEMRDAAAKGLPLKDVYKRLKKIGVTSRLLPGRPLDALSAMANSLGQFDMVLIDADQTDESLAQAWFYVPRIVTADTLVLRSQPAAEGLHAWQPISQIEIQQLAKAGRPRGVWHRDAA